MKLTCVMVVDDSEADQFICKNTIEKFDPEINILQAFDGQEALEILDAEKQQPEIIFLDINMPRMDGHEFLAAYNKREGQQAPVIVMLTSSSQEKDKERSMAYHCVKQYLDKPLDVNSIQDIEKLL